MAVVGIDHLYAATSGRERPVAFRKGPGLTFPERWWSDDHHAGHLTCGDAIGVLAGASPGTALTVDICFGAAGPCPADAGPGVVTPREPTPRMLGPDGRTPGHPGDR